MSKKHIDESNHSEFMAFALKEAEYAGNNKEVPVGCVFVHNGKVIVTGSNMTNVTKNPTRHAELVAIDRLIEMGYDLSILQECDLYVTLEPCIMCASALSMLGVNSVYFGATNERFGGNGTVIEMNKPHPRVQEFYHPYESTSNILKNGAIEVLQRFYSNGNPKAPETKRQRVYNNKIDFDDHVKTKNKQKMNIKTNCIDEKTT